MTTIYGDYTRIRQEVGIHASNVPETIIDTYLGRAARKFCQESSVWDEVVAQRTLSSPSGADLGQRLQIDLSGTFQARDVLFDTDAASIYRISELYWGQQRERPLDDQSYDYDRIAKVLWLDIHEIQEDMPLTIRAVLQPLQGVGVVPQFLLDTWSDALVEYAVFELLSMPQKAWTDPALASVSLNKYRDTLARAKMDKARGGTRKRLQQYNHPFP